MQTGTLRDRIHPTLPRTTVHATFPDGRVFEAPPGTPVGDFVRAAADPGLSGLPSADTAALPAPALPAVSPAPASPATASSTAVTPPSAMPVVAAPIVGPPAAPVVAVLLDGRLRELTAPVTEDSRVVPVTTGETDGVRIYRRSLSFLLMAAAADVFPGADVSIEHSASTVGGYFCEVRGRLPFTQLELWQIEERMRDIVAANAPIVRRAMPVAEAMALFEACGEDEKVRLLAHREKEQVVLYTLGSCTAYFQGHLAPSAGCLGHFALHAFPPGFLLQFPHQNRPTEIGPITPYPKLFQVYEEAGHWLNRLGIRSAGVLNDAIAAGRLPEVSLVAEALHEARLAQIAVEIASQGDRIKVVLIAGPSSSGKTTFSKRLAVQLLANGRRPFPVGLDDYFVDREATPRDAAGHLDYECLGAVDVGLFNDHLLSLMAGEPTVLPRYVFKTGRREAGASVTLSPGHVILVEGIHGLNPALVPGLPPECVYRVYVSALTQLNLDRHNRVSTTDCRLVRRIVRDAAQRGYTATQTLARWDSVTRGEKLHIFPFQENSDAIFNSALVHELAILRPLAEPLLLQVRHEAPEHVEANRLLSFLQWFLPASPEIVPDNSILREFVGRSIFESFRVWQARG
jgi:uridine kinase